MDTNKWTPSQVGEAAMDAGDWRSQLQADSRQRIVNKIMDTLKRHLPFSGQDGLQELSKIAVRIEEKIYAAATSQSDYLRELSRKMLTMETESQNSMGNSLQSNSADSLDSSSQTGYSSSQTGYSSSQTGYANGGDWREEVYQRIKVMKEKYLPELSEMYQKIATKLQQHDSLPQEPKSEQVEKLKMFKTMLERLISILQVSKSNISPGLKDKLSLYEKQIVNFINTNRPRKQGPPLQQGQLPPPHM
ncbi:mediator of RNA polymerase II transcription subunit 15a [Pyrus x bretschneideri]|uniref:mediator of RNA polymerase II transcription subunit 15a n=1 Tax=Pyrus x bretschneideri TaxID=225117 RepID=UPI00202ED6BA|nr:mediator of RNA polymerase II transcription subunit 15a [Pyrus x bretschneideri]